MYILMYYNSYQLTDFTRNRMYRPWMQQICISYSSSWTNTNYFPLQPKNWHNSTTVYFTLSNFPATKKKWHNRTTVLYTKYVRNTKNYFPPEPKKLTQHHNCMVLQVYSSMYNQNLFSARTKNWHNSTTGKKVPPAHAKRGQVPPAHAKRLYLFLCLSVRQSVSL